MGTSSQKKQGNCKSQKKPALVIGTPGPKTWEVMQLAGELKVNTEQAKMGD